MELTEKQILKIYDDYGKGQMLLCKTKADAFFRGVQYALRHIEGGKWVEKERGGTW